MTSIVVFSLFRFSGLNKVWAFLQMPFHSLILRNNKALNFYKLMGCGKGKVFSSSPDWSRYAFLAVVSSMEEAEKFVNESRFYKSYTKRSSEIWNGYFVPVQSYGTWGGVNPFEPVVAEQNDKTVAVLTRATVNRKKLKTFRKHALLATGEAGETEGLLYSVGMGEDPFIKQATFSIWKNLESMKNFAYKSPIHKEVVAKTRRDKWYREDLFARFSLISSEGTWSG